jgi:hypothetical protein
MSRHGQVARALLALPLVAGALAAADGVWPVVWREHTRVKVEAVAQPRDPVWVEGGGEAMERAVYNGPAGKFTATAWRLRDATAAYTYYLGMVPPEAVPLPDALVATTPGVEYAAYQNYVFQFEGWRPQAAEMEALYARLPALHSLGGLPKLVDYLPAGGRIRNSLRYIMGLSSLAAYAPSIPAAVVGFEQGTEGILARYATPKGELTLILFEYPTPQIARQYLAAYQRQAGWQVKRSGPLVALALGVDAATAKPLLDGVDWNVEFTWNNSAKRTAPPNVGSMLLGAIQLTGVLLGVTLFGGAMFAALGVWIRRRNLKEGEPDTGMISLNLHD